MSRYVEVVSNNVILASKARVMKSFLGKARGLMFSKLSGSGGLVFELQTESRRDAAIHMMFVFSPIDVVWLDAGKKIVDIRRSVLPFIGFAIPKAKAKYVIELNRKAARALRIGDVVDFKEI